MSNKDTVGWMHTVSLCGVDMDPICTDEADASQAEDGGGLGGGAGGREMEQEKQIPAALTGICPDWKR